VLEDRRQRRRVGEVARRPRPRLRGLPLGQPHVTRTYDPSSMSPQEALERLKAGNRRFIERVRDPDHALWRPGLAVGQWPFAVVLSCSDSRSPGELVFDVGLGDLFMIRIAGNVVAPSGIG